MPAPPENASPIRVAVLGASGIGRFHVRELARAGAEVVAIQGSSAASARRTAERLAREYGELGVAPRGLADLDEVLAMELDAVTIALPHERHREAAQRALLAGLHVLCEKPLFWHAGLSRDGAKPILAELAMAGARERLCVNTSNASFVRLLRERGRLPARPRAFEFRLATGARDEGVEIAVDLLPHALSLAHDLAGAGAPGTGPERVEARSTKHAFEASFVLPAASGELACRFLLEMHPDLAKSMTFRVDEVNVERVQRVDAHGDYRVLLRADGEELEAEDPFRVWIRAFLASVRTGAPPPVDFETSARILLDSLLLLEAAGLRGPSR